jgi:hypothetical protein
MVWPRFNQREPHSFGACLIRAKKKPGQAQQGHFSLFDIGALAGSQGYDGHFPLSLLARAARPPPLVPPRPGSSDVRAGESLATAGAVAGLCGKGKLPHTLLARRNP